MDAFGAVSMSDVNGKWMLMVKADVCASMSPLFI
jgi:hypothetical protein